MLFGHKYDIRAKVELENGKIYKVRCRIEARLVTTEDLLNVLRNEVNWNLNSPIKRIISIYDANG
jgi:hypothetical protein